MKCPDCFDGMRPALFAGPDYPCTTPGCEGGEIKPKGMNPRIEQKDAARLMLPVQVDALESAAHFVHVRNAFDGWLREAAQTHRVRFVDDRPDVPADAIIDAYKYLRGSGYLPPGTYEITSTPRPDLRAWAGSAKGMEAWARTFDGVLDASVHTCDSSVAVVVTCRASFSDHDGLEGHMSKARPAGSTLSIAYMYKDSAEPEIDGWLREVKKRAALACRFAAASPGTKWADPAVVLQEWRTRKYTLPQCQTDTEEREQGRCD